MAEYTPNFMPGQSVTYTAGGTITAGKVVHISATGRTITLATAGSDHTVGVACHDAATGALVTVSRGGEQKVTASGAITAGTPVKSGAAGTVAAWISGTDNASLIVGKAINTAADAALVDVTWTA